MNESVEPPISNQTKLLLSSVYMLLVNQSSKLLISLSNPKTNRKQSIYLLLLEFEAKLWI